ncbi:MAG: phosphoglucosamine mutase [Verrucomicrobiota bacterium]
MSDSKKRQLFGTDGVRGRANVHPITAEMALSLGRAAALVLGKNASGPCLIGKDTRASGDFLESAVAAGVAAEGVDVQLAGVVPTPAVAFLCRELGGAFGVVISASHNPFHDNGIKFFASDGYKLDDDSELALEALALANRFDGVEKVGRISRLDEAIEKYVGMAVASMGGGTPLSDMKIALDNANGAAHLTSTQVLTELGADLTTFYSDPDGTNINADCGCTHPRVIGGLVAETGASVGISHDGDADRVILCDETGDPLDGDEMLAIIGVDMINKGRLVQDTLVATIMSNCGLDECLKAHGGKVVRAGVGDRYVMQEMQKGGFNLGGEQSGHVICRDYNTTGDGILAALGVLRILVESGKPLSELRKVMSKFPQILINVAVREKPPLEELTGAQEAIAETQSTLGSGGRVLVRYSGTEPKLRVQVEGKDEGFIQEAAQRIATAVTEQIGA